MFRSVQFSAVLVGLVLLVGLAGCSDSGGLGTVPVKGTLTIDGQPANDVTITFAPLDSTMPTASGVVSDGSFELYSGAKAEPGAVPGKYKIVLAQAASSEETPDYMQAGATGAPQQELSFPVMYIDASTSDKEVEVTSGSNDIKIDIPGA